MEGIGPPSFKTAVQLTRTQAIAIAGELLTASTLRQATPVPTPAKPVQKAIQKPVQKEDPKPIQKQFPQPQPKTVVATGPTGPIVETAKAEVVFTAPRPLNHGKPWTPAEEALLINAFDAQESIPALAKAHERGVGAIQNRLTKLGKMTEEQYVVYPPEVV